MSLYHPHSSPHVLTSSTLKSSCPYIIHTQVLMFLYNPHSSPHVLISSTLTCPHVLIRSTLTCPLQGPSHCALAQYQGLAFHTLTTFFHHTSPAGPTDYQQPTISPFQPQSTNPHEANESHADGQPEDPNSPAILHSLLKISVMHTVLWALRSAAGNTVTRSASAVSAMFTIGRRAQCARLCTAHTCSFRECPRLCWIHILNNFIGQSAFCSQRTLLG
jgi:hypothetical protein